MKRVIFAGLIGAAVGSVAGYYYCFHKNFKELSEKVDALEADKEEDDDLEIDDDEPIVRSIRNITREDLSDFDVDEESDELKERREHLERVKYAAAFTHPTDDVPITKEDVEAKKEAIKEHTKDIELMKAEEWWDDDDEYEYDELYFFVNENILMAVADNSEELDIEELTGNIFDRIGFASNDDENIFIRNNKLKRCFKIIKVVDISPDEMYP